jgi:putative phosphoribosyl transferase
VWSSPRPARRCFPVQDRVSAPSLRLPGEVHRVECPDIGLWRRRSEGADHDGVFRDRADAGRRLGAAVRAQVAEEAVVLGLPRGGVVVAAEVARALQAPLDVVVVRKLGTPGNPELGLGAIAEGDVVVLNEGLIARLGIGSAALEAVEAAERTELARRVEAFRRGRPPLPVEDRTAIIVDDGLATGYTARAGVQSARRRGAVRVVLAVPVAAPEAFEALQQVADDVICLETPGLMFGVGGSYQDFRQTGDDEVRALLDEASLT